MLDDGLLRYVMHLYYTWVPTIKLTIYDLFYKIYYVCTFFLLRTALILVKDKYYNVLQNTHIIMDRVCVYTYIILYI